SRIVDSFFGQKHLGRIERERKNHGEGSEEEEADQVGCEVGPQADDEEVRKEARRQRAAQERCEASGGTQDRGPSQGRLIGRDRRDEPSAGRLLPATPGRIAFGIPPGRRMADRENRNAVQPLSELAIRRPAIARLFPGSNRLGKA
ncbi:MAG: hypothetical protein ACXWVF_08355, partial [Telluria sp.]